MQIATSLSSHLAAVAALVSAAVPVIAVGYKAVTAAPNIVPAVPALCFLLECLLFQLQPVLLISIMLVANNIFAVGQYFFDCWKLGCHVGSHFIATILFSGWCEVELKDCNVSDCLKALTL